MTGAFLKIRAAQVQFHTFAVMIMDDGGVLAAGELEFACDGAGLQVLITLQIEQWIFAVLPIELLRHVIDDDIVPIFATEAMIAIGRDDVQFLLLDSHDGDVEGAATEIEHEHRLVLV